MSGRIYRELRPVVRRQRAMLMLQSTLVGCVVAAVAVIYLGALRLVGRDVSPVAALGLLVGGPALGLAVGATAGRGWRRAARAVDDHYGLKDRSFTALAFLGEPGDDPLRELQLRDAEAHLASVAAGDVVPFREAKFDQAAKALEALEAPPVDKKETRSLEEKLKQVAQAMGDVGLGQMGGATGELADGVKSSNKAKFQKATRTLAEIAKGHGKRKEIKEILDAELATLGECKECNSEFASRGKRPEKSISPSTSWGLATSGNVIGDKTSLQSRRDVKEVTGVEGEGSSEMETTHSPEGRQAAARGYRESYQKYKKMSESVLDSEPIPLGHRQAIRKYFELIRPEGGGSDAKADGADAPAPARK